MARSKTALVVQTFYALLNLFDYTDFTATRTTAAATEKTSPLSVCAAYHPADILCNNDTSDSKTFACVCYTADASLSNAYPDCYSFVVSVTLPALRLVLAPYRNDLKNFESLSKETVPLNRRLVSPEYYLKRKISNIISSYCADEIHNCKSISRTIHPSNVLILRLSCVEEDLHQFVVDYTIVKSAEAQNLTETSVIEPGLILAALRPKLERTIPYKVINHEPHAAVPFPADSESLDDDSAWNRLWGENTGIITAVTVIAVLVAMIYMIATLKAIRDRAKRQCRSQSPKNESNGVPEKAAHYGATEEHSAADSPVQKVETCDGNNVLYTSVGDVTENDLSDPASFKGPNGYFPQTPANGTSLSAQDEGSQDFQPPPPEPLAQSARPMPSKRTTTTTTTTTIVTSSQSMQLQNLNKKNDQSQPQNGVKKAATFQAFGDKSKRQSSLGSMTSEPPTPPSMILDDYGKGSFTSPVNSDEKTDSQEKDESDRSRTPTVIQVPVLIVPAMETHRNDKDYDTNKSRDYDHPTLPVDEKYIEYDRRNGGSDTEEPETHRRNRRRKDVPQIRAAVSEECLLPKDSVGNILGPDQQISSMSSGDTPNSDAEGNLDRGGFHLLLSGIGYQPLRESDWSVMGPNDEETEHSGSNN